MELIIFAGLQGSGKSTFYARHLLHSHVRINLDMLKTRHREGRLFRTCLETRQPLVIDNTNPARADRARYIPVARDAGFRILGYYFSSPLEVCKARNAARSADQVVPLRGLLGTRSRLEVPSLDEGFDALHFIRIDDDGNFVVEDWRHEV